MLVLCYPRCSTCQKALAFLDQHGLKYELRNIAEENPSVEELKRWHELSGLPLKRFFNTSGMLYREQKLSERLPNLSEAEQYEILASSGMLVKRPLVVLENTVLLGFREAEWLKALGL